jgi:hypothetical protein
MEAKTDDEAGAQRRQPQDADRLVMRSVIGHEKLLGMIQERNPILALRDRERRVS